MITTHINNKIQLNPTIELLDSETFFYAYIDQLFVELGVENIEGVEPLRGDDPWYLSGVLHGEIITATFNSFENLILRLFNVSVSYKFSMKETINNFIETYRENWVEHHKNRKQT